MSHPIIQLGAYGDIINALPVLHWENHLGRRPELVVSSAYVDLLEATSYVDTLEYPGHYSEVARARRMVFTQPHKIMQVYNSNHTKVTETFLRDSWHRVGYDRRWEQLGLVFDRRNRIREAKLVAKLDLSKPVVLVVHEGKSSPFPHAAKLMAALRAGLPDHNVVDMADIKARRLYDLLGLFDVAQCLVCNDTGPLHLAAASSVPVVALMNPAPWLGTIRKANHVLHRTFNEFDAQETVRAVLGCRTYTGSIAHVWNDYRMPKDARDRNKRAAKSWTMPQVPVHVDQLTRNATAIGDNELAYVRDLIDEGFKHADAVVFTNADSGLCVGAEERIRRLLGAKGAIYGCRWDFDKVEGPMEYHDVVKGRWRGGYDLFAFTRAWWERFRDEVPDFVIGRAYWDIIYRDWIRMNGGGELYGCVWHQDHASPWKEGHHKGNDWNTKFYKQWWANHDTTRPFENCRDFEFIPWH